MSFAPWRESLRRAGLVGAFGVAGFLATYGFWGAILQREFANPFFPYFNAYFDSAWWEPISIRDTRYGPRGILDAIVYPWRFIVDGRLADDAKFRDPRVLVLMLLAAACAVKRLRHADGGLFSRPEWRFVAVFAGVAYLAWLAAFGIYRYLIPVEILSGPLLVACAVYLVTGVPWQRRACVLLALAMVAATMKQGWGRLPAGARYFEGPVPAIDADAVVILEPQQPLAHVIPFFPASARFVAPESNFLAPAQENALARRAARIVAEQQGPLYSLDRAESRDVERVLAFYGLRRDTAACRAFASPLTQAPLRLCPVSRAAA